MCSSKFSEQLVLEGRKSGTCSRTPSSWQKKIGVTFAMSACEEISTISREELQIINKSIFCTECIQSRGQHSKFPLLHW